MESDTESLPEANVFYFESDHLALRGNKDYLNMLRTIAVLQAQKIKAQQHIEELALAKNRYLEDPELFLAKIKNNEEIISPNYMTIATIPEISHYDDMPPEELKTKDDTNTDTCSHNKSDVPNNRGRCVDDSKPETFNQLWTVEEQKLLEELLIKYPAERIEMHRFSKIAKALGNRTARQVSSRVQKYFQKLHSAGMPVPGRIPKNRRVGQAKSKHYYRPSTFFPSHNVPVHMPEDDFLLQDLHMPSADSNNTENARSNSIETISDLKTENITSEVQQQIVHLLKIIKQEKLSTPEGYNPDLMAAKCETCQFSAISRLRWRCNTCYCSLNLCADCLVHQLVQHKFDHFSHDVVAENEIKKIKNKIFKLKSHLSSTFNQEFFFLFNHHFQDSRFHSYCILLWNMLMIHIFFSKFIKSSEFLKTVSFQLIKFKFMEITSMENKESLVDLTQDVDNAIIKSKLISGEYKFSLKRKKSKVWETFGMLENSNGHLIPNIVACKICLNIYKFLKSTSNLVRHKCYLLVNTKRLDNEEVDVDLETRTKCTKIITEWSVLNCRPFTTTAYAEIKKLASFFVSVGASFGTNVKIETLLPNPTTVSININHLYEFHTNEIKSEISKIKCNSYGLTSGMWADNYIASTFMSVTIHYIWEGKIVSRLLALRSMRGDACTDADIKQTFSNVLEEFGCELEEDNPIIVTDRGSNMISAFHSNNNVYCINHLINNIVEQTVSSVPELTKLITDCRNLVKFFKKSGINSNMETSLEILCPTSWNTIFYLLQSVEKNWYEINNILKERGELDRIQYINFNNLRSITSLLKTFENSSKTLEAHNISTLHLVIPHIHRLKIVCVKKYDDTDIVKRAKASFLELLQTVVYQNLTIFHKVALFLFPPTNKLTQYSETEKEEIMEACKHISKSLFKTIPDSNPNDTLQQCQNNDIFADFVEKHQPNNLDTRIANEIQAYKNISILITDKFDAIQWWNAHESQFPHLFKASCKILATPASSAPSERAFSAARQLITEKRCSVLKNLDLVDKIMFLHSNISEIDDNVLEDIL